MPADNPEIGETWELYEFYEPQAERAPQAVIVDILPPGPGAVAPTVRLVNRLGRVVTLPQNSLVLTWRLIHEAVTHPCWYHDRPGGCDRRASLQVNDPSGWVWVCDRHLPAGHQALLPFDRPEDRDSLTVQDNQCPRCNEPMTTPGSGSEVDPETEVAVMHCGHCGSRWVSLMARGEVDDGVVLAENITAASEALHGQATNVRAIAGFTAWAAIRRIIQPASHVVGTPIQQSNSMGANNVVVIGDRLPAVPSRRGVTAEVRQHSPLTPAVGSIWQTFNGRELVEVANIRDDPEEGDVVVFLDASGENHDLSLREFLGRYTLNGRPRLQPGDAHPMAPRRVEPRLPGPRAGDTWWQRRTGRPVFVVASEVDDDGRRVVRYRDGTNLPMPIELDEFLEEFTIDPPDPGCLAGEEWVDGDGNLLKIEEVRLGRREVVGLTGKGTRSIVPLALFMVRYRKLTRRSVYDRLQEDDDDI